MNSELTIVSVYHSLPSKRLLELNLNWTRALNPEETLNWIVVDNSPPAFSEKLTSGAFSIIPGVPFSDVFGQDEYKHIPPLSRGSFHHAIALNESLKHIKTRFLLMLDNDFFVLRPNWLSECVNHMKKNNLAFFGTAYNPKRFAKYRYFPATHQFFFTDGAKADFKTFDFRPQYLNMLTKNWAISKEDLKKSEKIKASTVQVFSPKRWARKALKTILSGDRLSVGISRDTGSAIYLKYGRNANLKSECIQPVFGPTKFSFIVRAADVFLPERFSFTPKRADYYSTKGFKELGYADAAGKKWEEYIWRERPFAIHLRNNKLENLEEKLVEIKKTLKTFALNR